MKQLLALLILIALFSCSSPLEEEVQSNSNNVDSAQNQEGKVEIPGTSDNSWYVPKTVQTDIALEGTMNDIPTDFSFDSTYNDTNALYLVTSDSVYLYSYSGDSLYSEGISKSNPEFDMAAFNSAFSTSALETSGFILDSITLDSAKVSIEESSTSLKYVVVQDFTIHTSLAEYTAAKVQMSGAATISTNAEKYTAKGFPENWPLYE